MAESGTTLSTSCRNWHQPILIRPSQLPRMQLWVIPRKLKRVQGEKTRDLDTLFKTDFTVHFFSVRTCPNSLKIQFMANAFQPLPFYEKDDQVLLIHVLLQSWLQETDLLPTSSWLLVISTPPLLIQPQHLHSDRHMVTFPHKAHRKGPEPTNLLVLITPSANHSKS